MRAHALIPFILLSLFPSIARADKILEGYTVVKGKNFAFEVKAPRSWILDSEIGRNQGLNVVFYPTGTDWGASKAVCYARVRTIDARVHTIDDQVADTLNNLHNSGSPNARTASLTRSSSPAPVPNQSTFAVAAGSASSSR